MSGISEETTCPICGEQMSTYTDWKPFNSANNECIYCGFASYTKVEQMKLEEVNNLRKEHNENYEPDEKLEPLTQADLDKWKKEIEEI